MYNGRLPVFTHSSGNSNKFKHSILLYDTNKFRTNSVLSRAAFCPCYRLYWAHCDRGHNVRGHSVWGRNARGCYVRGSNFRLILVYCCHYYYLSRWSKFYELKQHSEHGRGDIFADISADIFVRSKLAQNKTTTTKPTTKLVHVRDPMTTETHSNIVRTQR